MSTKTWVISGRNIWYDECQIHWWINKTNDIQHISLSRCWETNRPTTPHAPIHASGLLSFAGLCTMPFRAISCCCQARSQLKNLFRLIIFALRSYRCHWMCNRPVLAVSFCVTFYYLARCKRANDIPPPLQKDDLQHAYLDHGKHWPPLWSPRALARRPGYCFEYHFLLMKSVDSSWRSHQDDSLRALCPELFVATSSISSTSSSLSLSSSTAECP